MTTEKAQTREQIKSRVTRHEERADGYVEEETAALNSVEITLSAKGDYHWNVKRYYRPDQDWQGQVAEIADIDAELRRRFTSAPEPEEARA